MVMARRVEDQRTGGGNACIVLRDVAGDIDITLRYSLVAVCWIGRVRREEDQAQFNLVGQYRPGRPAESMPSSIDDARSVATVGGPDRVFGVPLGQP